MIIEIKSMGLTAGILRQDGLRMVAAFTAVIGPVELNHCTIMQKEDGHLSICAPFVKVARQNIRAIRVVDRDVWEELVRLALTRYREELQAEPDDAGLRRVLCAGGQESLRAAGI
jgi:hypothetical protein